MRPRIGILLLAVLWAVPAGVWAEANSIRAVVNDTVITQFQVEANAAPAVDLLKRQYFGQPAVLNRKIAETLDISLKQLIERQLIVHDFKVAGYNLPEPLIEDYIRERIRQQFGDRTTLITKLKAEGKSFEKYRQEMRERIIVAGLEAKNVGNAFIASPLKMEKYYDAHQKEFQVTDQVKLRMLVLDGTASPTPEGRQKLAEEIRRKILEGATFTEMATLYSSGSQRGQGGDWGWVERPVLRKELADVAFVIELNKVSDVVATPEVCYLMLVEERKPAHVKPIGEVRDEIEKALLLEERSRLQQRYVDKLERKTFVRKY
jgi:parvulin-like peptidyl-prolyl isomerase